MNRTDAAHYGTGSVMSLTQNQDKTSILHTTQKDGTLYFKDYLMDAVNTVNSQQMDVTRLQEQVITDPESVDVADVTIAMQKARMSLSLAQTVIDRLVSGWSELTTVR